MDNPKKLTTPGTQDTGQKKKKNKQTNKKNKTKQQNKTTTYTTKGPNKTGVEPRRTRKTSNPCLAQDTRHVTHAKMNSVKFYHIYFTLRSWNVLNVVERLFCNHKNKTIF